ncbi:MAG: hypothetical protein QXJ64_08860 [Thermosphaera sp.]
MPEPKSVLPPLIEPELPTSRPEEVMEITPVPPSTPPVIVAEVATNAPPWVTLNGAEARLA